MMNEQIKKLANEKIPLYNNSSSLYDIFDWIREKKFLFIEIQWYFEGWTFVIYNTTDLPSKDIRFAEPYFRPHFNEEFFKDYQSCLEAGIIAALNLI